MKHQSSRCGLQCMVIHGDGHGACLWCVHCRTMIRPQNMNQECPGVEKKDEDESK